MSLVLNISNARDLLAKLKRDERRLLDALSTGQEDAIGDALFDFAVTGHSIKDWAKSATMQTPSKIDVEALVKSNVYLQACRDIANSSKHQSITRYISTTSRVYASLDAAYSLAGVPGETQTIPDQDVPRFKFKVLMTDGLKFEIGQFARNVIATWDNALAQLGL